MKTVLCFSGGGVRGIISLVLMKELEKKEKIVPDLLCGVSTGAIIAGAYSISMKTEDILKVYLEEIWKIFKKDFWYNIRSLNGLINPKYQSEQLRESLRKILGNIPISCIEKKLMITAYNITEDIPQYWKSYKSEITNYAALSDAVEASCSAPTFFEPKEIFFNRYVDGGVDQNDLCLSAYIEAKKLFPDEKIRIISVGTGNYKYKYSVKKGGISDWLKDLISLFMMSNSTSPPYILKKVLQDGDIFEEINVNLKNNIELDDIRKETIDFMLNIKKEE